MRDICKNKKNYEYRIVEKKNPAHLPEEVKIRSKKNIDSSIFTAVLIISNGLTSSSQHHIYTEKKSTNFQTSICMTIEILKSEGKNILKRKNKIKINFIPRSRYVITPVMQ